MELVHLSMSVLCRIMGAVVQLRSISVRSENISARLDRYYRLFRKTELQRSHYSSNVL